MNFKLKFFLLILFIIIAVTLITFLVQQKESKYKPGIYSEYDKAVSQAQLIYSENKQLGKDFSNGPCLTNALMPGWVLDIVHVPRLPMDDLSANQCSAFREGSARHFIELDPDGNLVRVH